MICIYLSETEATAGCVSFAVIAKRKHDRDAVALSIKQSTQCICTKNTEERSNNELNKLQNFNNSNLFHNKLNL